MATGLTWLQLTNAVLRRLRESTVSTVTSTSYTTLIGDFVNETKREVEDAWDWTRLRTTATVTCVPGTSLYTLTNLTKRVRVLNAYNTTYKQPMEQTSFSSMQDIFQTTTPQSAEPQYYNFFGASSNDPTVRLYPVPIAASVITFNIIQPQDDFSSDSTVLLVPDWPVILGAWAKAISERGEDGGANANEVDSMYRGALADAIQQDQNFAPDETIWAVA